MLMVRQGASENLTATLPEGINPTDYDKIYFDIVHGDLQKTVPIDEITIDGQNLTITLTPTDTAIMQAGYRGWVQVSLFNEDNRLISDKEPFVVLPRLVKHDV